MPSTLPEVAVAEDTRSRVTTYEEAMRKIQDATGVSDVQEVVDRFMVQGETQENLKALQQANAEHLAKLREVRYWMLLMSALTHSLARRRMLALLKSLRRSSTLARRATQAISAC